VFEAVDPKVSFPELELRILRFWRENAVFSQSLEAREGSPAWAFYDGPPTANGQPGLHHTESRTFKDLYPRFKTMTGHFVGRKAGWDCHGLPVELEVEKEIGTKTKRDIEAFGIAEFNRLCRESVLRYVDDWERLTERLGFWIDMSQAYRTMDAEYIESVWWSLAQLHRQGLLFQADRVTAYCPRCGTALSDHETALGYTQVEDPSVYVKFRVVESPRRDLVGVSLLGWTTTPWTLISNAGIAVKADAPYLEIRAGDDRLVVSEAAYGMLSRHPGWSSDASGWQPLRTFQGGHVIGSRYEPLYPNVQGAHRVVGADFVSLEEGTGVVHMAPAFGPEDLEVGKREGWPVFRPLDGEGRFTEEAPPFVRGLFFKDADEPIIDDLRSRGLLVRAETIEHTYPLCWRCDTPLIYVARSSWYVRTTAVKDRMLEINEAVNWYPDHIKHGRYGDWLENNVDWALSRERYWGTPLPIWRCADGHDTAIASLAELSEKAGWDVSGIDPHRPAIDEVIVQCPECGTEARRVLDVIDAWYDSGAMPFAQWGYHPDLRRGIEEFEGNFPADYIAEAIDQTRGWFYTLMAEATLFFDRTAYRNVVCLGLLVDAQGRKMSKSLGNSIDPFDVMERVGADALRWYLVTSGSPWADRRVGMELLDEVVRQFLLTLWNVYSFFVTYANASGFEPGPTSPPGEDLLPLDRWIRSQLAQTTREARAGLEAYDATGAGRRIARFVDDLSNWYVRLARRRFWDPGGGGGADTRAAFRTLHECLVTLTQLLAPFTPFLSEELWRNLSAGRDGAPLSVHLSSYPQPDQTAIDPALDESMAAARDIVELGRRVRSEAKVKVRQPLLEAVVHFPGDREALRPLLPLIAQELNVREVLFAETADQLGRWRAKPRFSMLGPRLGQRVKEVAAALSSDDGTFSAALAEGESVTVSTASGEVTLGPDDVDLSQETVEGWGLAGDGRLTVALELELTDELRREGLARDLVRVVQDARKAAGLAVTDRIALGIEANGDEARGALASFEGFIASETLATTLTEGILPEAAFRQESSIDGSTVIITLRKA
jgi:isoleucyl-tRNA synthetase